MNNNHEEPKRKISPGTRKGIYAGIVLLLSFSAVVTVATLVNVDWDTVGKSTNQINTIDLSDFEDAQLTDCDKLNPNNMTAAQAAYCIKNLKVEIP